MNVDDLRVIHLLGAGSVGGVSRAVCALALAQRRMGRNVAVGFCDPTGPTVAYAAAQGLQVVDLGLRRPMSIRGALKARAALASFDLHHFHAPEPALMAASMSHRQALRVYTHRSGVVSYGAKRALRYRVFGALARRSAVVTGTRQAALSAARTARIPAGRIIETWNGCDFDRLDAGRSRAEMRHALGIDDGTMAIGVAAELRELKRVDWLLEAVAGLRGNWRLLVIGDGADRRRLEELASRLRLDNVEFVGMQSEIGEWLRVLDVFALPSGPDESFGNAVVEAMACGVPTIVASDCPAHLRHVENGVTGYVVSSPDELRERLAFCLGHRSEIDEIGSAGRALARARYSLARSVAAFDVAYAAALFGA